MRSSTTVPTMNGQLMLPEVGKLNRIMSTMHQKTANQAIGLENRPRLQTRSFIQSVEIAPRKMHIPYAAYRKIVLIAVTMTMAVPVPTMNVATVKSQATTTIAVSELAGVRYRCETFFSQRDPGIPSSRLNAYS